LECPIAEESVSGDLAAIAGFVVDATVDDVDLMVPQPLQTR
jgi:hypothetical protein